MDNSESPDRGYTERYKQFLRLGGGANHKYMAFIRRMKREYLGVKNSFEGTVSDHDDFTRFIIYTVDKELS